MGLGALWDRLRGRRHGGVRSFDHDVTAGGGVVGQLDRGYKEVPVDKIVGSVGRWQNLRSDFFYKSGKVTKRFERIAEAMSSGKSLPPVELYKVKPKHADPEHPALSQYYVVDGNHRVAMAKKFGQAALDAHVVEFKVEHRSDEPGDAPAPADPPAPA